MAFRSASSAIATGTITKPAGVVAGDKLIAILSVDGTGGAFSSSDGFTQLADNVLFTPDGQHVAVWWRDAGGSEPATYTFASAAAVVMGAWSGRASGAPTVSTLADSGSANSSPISAAANGITASAGDDLAFAVGLDITGISDAWALSGPSGYTLAAEASGSPGVWVHAAMSYRDNVSAGATGTQTGTLTRTVGSSGAGYMCWVVGMAAAASAATLVQEGYRFGLDDGSESTHTWAAAQDTPATMPAGEPRVLAFNIDATGSPGAKVFKLQYRKVGDPSWTDMPLE